MTHLPAFDFHFTRPYLIAGLLFGVSPSTCQVRVSSGGVAIRFGPWRANVERDNIADARITGPYRFLKTAGPAHLSLADRGITFATNAEQGVCIRLHTPIRAIEPTGLLRHPGVTVTVADCEGLLRALV
ncbi:hypothetical protein PP713_14540 [Mycobacterium sp. CSUR Q5927]|nr:hypothetical protein [Mycobacterium sp. CSUR Q5927]